jgi:hypothetical protein
MLALLSPGPPDLRYNTGQWRAALPEGAPAMPGPNGVGHVIDVTPTEADRTPKVVRVGPDDDDIFTFTAAIPVLVGADGMRILQGADSPDDDGTSSALRTIKFLETTIWPEDLPRFQERLRDLKRPIDHRLMFHIMERLMTEWGLRPTPPPEPSSGGSPNPDAGTNSTDEPPPKASTSPASPSTAP